MYCRRCFNLGWLFFSLFELRSFYDGGVYGLPLSLLFSLSMHTHTHSHHSLLFSRCSPAPHDSASTSHEVPAYGRMDTHA